MPAADVFATMPAATDSELPSNVAVPPIPPEPSRATDAEAHSLKKVPSTASQLATSSAAEANPSSNGHPEKATPASSELEKDMDLEAGGNDSSRSSREKKEEAETAQVAVDPNIVDWDGPDDPQNPINWSSKLKWGNVAVISSITFLT